MNGKKGSVFTPIDSIAGVLLILGGISLLIGRINLGTFFAGLGLLVEAIKIMFKQGL